MNKKFKFAFLLFISLSFGACSNLKNTFTPTPNYTTMEKSKFNIHEETELFSLGSSTIRDSGVAVAQMKAKEQAKSYLKDQILDEATLVLNSFLDDTLTQNISISSSTIGDLAKLVSSQLITEAKQTNVWEENNQEFIVLAIDKNLIPKKSKEIFTGHLKGIVNALNSSIEKISQDHVKVIDKTQEIKNKKVAKTAPIVKDTTSEDSTSSSNSDPEVYLDDF